MSLKIQNLKTLNQTTPIAVNASPYFSWTLESDERDTIQTSYHIVVSDGEHPVFDSGIVESNKNAYIPYNGSALKSATIYSVAITVTDNHHNSAHVSGTFETSLLRPDEFCAVWVKSPFKRKKNKSGFGRQQPATLFRKEFNLPAKPVKARLYATCHGIYEAYINGRRTDAGLFAPGHTVYGRYLCFQTYNVTELLQEGDNVLGMQVGDGWYFCSQTLANMKYPDYQHAILFMLDIQYEDGSRERIFSDAVVKAAYGPVRSSDLFAGELYDANQEIRGWNTAGFSDSAWKNCVIGKYPMDNLVIQTGEPVEVVEELPVKEVLHSPKGETILDFGQNMAGFVKMKIHYSKGTEITLEHCEVLDREGNYINNILSAGGVGKGCDQKDVYICDGEETIYQPHFTYHGFRYVRISGVEVNPADFTACVVSTCKNSAGTFRSSDENLNRLYRNILWSQRSNMLSIPTDCPQREKAGWTGDMLVYAKTAMLNEDCTNLFTRWLENMTCDQSNEGEIPMVVPLSGSYPMMGKIISLTAGVKGGIGTSSGWGDAAVIVPYSMYQITGNMEILKQQYDCMKKWCNYVVNRATNYKPKKNNLPDEIEKYLWNTGYHYGEWLIPSQSKNGVDTKNLKSIMAQSSCYTAPIFGYYSISTFAKIATLLSEMEPDCIKYYKDKHIFADMAANMKNAFIKGVIQEGGSMPSDLMGAYVLPVYFDLVPEEHKEKFWDNLVKSVEEHDYCMDTGFLATPFLLDALCMIGRKDLAYRLLWQDKQPSWLYEVKAGGTTIWENSFGYDEQGNPGNLSFNHYSFGCVADWIYRHVAGIDTDTAGYTHLIIHPDIDSGVTFCEREFMTSQGKVKVYWSMQGGRFMLDVKIPCNTTATIKLPDGKIIQTGSGEYAYDIEI